MIVLRVNTEEMQVEILLDAPVAEALALMTPEGEGKRMLSLSRLIKKTKPRNEIKATSEIRYQDYVVRELESGTIEVEQSGVLVTPVLPTLKELAHQLNVPLLNSNGNPFNTRQLGSQIIKSVAELQRAEVQPGAATDVGSSLAQANLGPGRPHPRPRYRSICRTAERTYWPSCCAMVGACRTTGYGDGSASSHTRDQDR